MEMNMEVIGVIDTMFAIVNMGEFAREELKTCPGYGEKFEIVSETVPGFKDLAVGAKKLIEERKAKIVIALGMPGKESIDQVCAHEASQGIMLAQLLTSTHILEVFVHQNESNDPKEFLQICEQRAKKHARNAYWLLYDKDQLKNRAGMGIRQGFGDVGPLKV